jgi:hypothetical protein
MLVILQNARQTLSGSKQGFYEKECFPSGRKFSKSREVIRNWALKEEAGKMRRGLLAKR